MNCKCLFIAAPASGQGKTSVIAGLARHHRMSGLNVRVFKTGPDFIDPTILEIASGNPVYTLDLWMVGEQQCKHLLYQASLQADIILIEGVMGLFDGKPSSADLAQAFGIPVAVVIDASAMAQTFGAIAYGLTNYRKEISIAGVFANRVAGDRHQEMLQESCDLDTPWLGCLMRNESYSIPERHLGLHRATDIGDLEARLDLLANEISKTPLANCIPVIQILPMDIPSKKENTLQNKVIAVAKDAAFNFIYPANIDWLERQGARVEYFSPIHDTHFPNADALYLPGGYPELYLEQLSENTAILAWLHEFHKSKKPVLAECGGMLLLLEKLTYNDKSARLAGLIKASATVNSRLAGIGMQVIDANTFYQQFNGSTIKGHSFHYSSLDSAEGFLEKTKHHPSGREGEYVYYYNNLLASYVHWYFPSNGDFFSRLFNG